MATKKTAAKKAATKKVAVKKTAAKKAAPAAPKIPAAGFCLAVTRVREEKRAGASRSRTVGDYQCYWNGQAEPALKGQIVEPQGPGDNTSTGKTYKRRIAPGTYRLRIQDGKNYKTYGYAASGFPLPGIGFDDADTGSRSAILLHPCHDASGYLSTIGCLNAADGLVDANSKIKLADSRTRVIAIIEGMKARMGAAFPKTGRIPNAVAVITGDP